MLWTYFGQYQKRIEVPYSSAPQSVVFFKAANSDYHSSFLRFIDHHYFYQISQNCEKFPTKVSRAQDDVFKDFVWPTVQTPKRFSWCTTEKSSISSHWWSQNLRMFDILDWKITLTNNLLAKLFITFLTTD